MFDDSVYCKEREKFILRIRDAIIVESIQSGYDIIVGDTNFSKKHERRIRSIVPKGTEVIINDEFLSVPVEKCILCDKATRYFSRR